MDLPELVDSHLEGERVVGSVDLDGDAVFVTPTRTLLYREEGLLSDESVTSYPHDVERIEVSEGRRKATVRMSDLTETSEFSVPATHVDDVLAPLLWGVLRTAGVIDDGEGLLAAYRFSELTLVVTDVRILKHVGTAVWDEEFEEFHYGALTDLAFEEGSVAMSLVLEVDGRRERVKTPKEQGPVVRRTVEEAVFGFHGVDSLASLREKISPEADEDGGGDSATDSGGDAGEPTDVEASGPANPDEGPAAGSVAGGYSDITGLLEGAGEPGEAGEEGEVGEEGEAGEEGEGGARASESPHRARDTTDRTATVDAAVVERLDEVESTLSRQTELLEAQQAMIDQLIEELRRGR